jgi:hypothetical protein
MHERPSHLRQLQGSHRLQDFVTATDKLLKVRSGTVSLRHRIGELNEEVQAGGESLKGKVSGRGDVARSAAPLRLPMPL